jgi:hypothetical protein
MSPANFVIGFIYFIFSGLNGYENMWLYVSSYFLLVQILSFFAGRKILLGYESIGVDGTKKNHYLRIYGLFLYSIMFIISFLKLAGLIL